MKTLDDAVIELNGVLPQFSESFRVKGEVVLLCCIRDFSEDGEDYLTGKYYQGGVNYSTSLFRSVGSVEQFQQRAKELGFINGYRWGVVYPTNSTEPDLPGDTYVATCKYMHQLVSETNWLMTIDFKITDQRYKPVDTSYLNEREYNGVADIDQLKVESMSLINVASTKDAAEPTKPILNTEEIIKIKTDADARISEAVSEMIRKEGALFKGGGADWYDYENQKMITKTPPMDYECEYSDSDFLGWKSVNTLALILRVLKSTQ